MALPISPKMRLFIKSDKEADIVTVSQYITDKSKSSKLDEGIVKNILNTIHQGESFDCDVLETPAQKKGAKALVTAVKADLKAHATNKASYEANAEKVKAEKAKERENLKLAVLADKQESSAMMELSISDDDLVAVNAQLTESAVTTIRNGLSAKFIVDESGILSINPEDAPSKQDFADAFASVAVMGNAGDAVKDSASKVEAQIGYNAKLALGDSWSNLFSSRPDDLSRIQKGVKVFTTVAAFKNKRAKSLFAQLPFSTSRALLEFKITTAELEGGKQDVAEQKNLDAKKELFLKAHAVQEAKNEAKAGIMTQREAKALVAEYKKELGIGPAAKMNYYHLVVVTIPDSDKKVLKIFGSDELDKENVRLAMASFNTKGERLTISKDGKTVDHSPIEGPDAVTLAFLLDHAAPAPKEEPKATKGSKQKDEQEEDKPKAVQVNKKAAPLKVVPKDEEEDEEEVKEEEEDEEQVLQEAQDEDETPTGTKGLVADEDDEE